MSLRPDYPITTDRLVLRPLAEADLDALVSYHSRAEVHRYLPTGPFDRATAAERLHAGPWSHSVLDAPGEFLTLGVVLAAGGELVGDVVLMWHDAELGHGEIGYVLHPDHAGMGYATEAGRALLRLAFDDLGLRRVAAHIVRGNDASVRVAERLGMRHEGHLVEGGRVAGQRADLLIFAIREGEWRTQHP